MWNNILNIYLALKVVRYLALDKNKLHFLLWKGFEDFK